MRAKTIFALTAVMAVLVMGGPGGWALPSYTGGDGASYAMGAMTNDVEHVGVVVVAISSAADQSFSRGYAPVAISPITITDATNTPVISNNTSIAVWIPAAFAMTWDATNCAPTFGGSAANKVNPSVSYAGANQRLVIAVTNDFAAQDTLTISALAFRNYVGFGSARLELDYDNDGIVDAQNDKTIMIYSAYYSGGGPGDNYALDQMIRDRCLNPIGTIWSIY